MPRGEAAQRIATIVTRLDLGGAQQIALALAAGAASRGQASYLIAGAGGYLDEQARQLAGVRVELWGAFKHPIRPWSDLITLVQLANFLKRERIELVHTHSSKAGFIGRAAAKLAKVPHILHTVHGWPFHEHQAGMMRGAYIRLERVAARWTERLIAVSAATRDQGLRAGIGRPEQYDVVFPGSDLTNFQPGTPGQRDEVRREFGFAPTAELVGMVACFKPQKAPLDFVRAAAQVLTHRPGTRFLLVGDGEMRPRIEAEIRRLGLTDRVLLAGWRQDVSRLMGALDVLGHSALWEGLPCVFAQAQSAGVPIVATEVDGTREALEDGQAGLLVPPGQPGELAQGILRVLAEPALRNGLVERGRAWAGRFAMPEMVKAVERIYDQVFKRDR